MAKILQGGLSGAASPFRPPRRHRAPGCSIDPAEGHKQGACQFAIEADKIVHAAELKRYMIKASLSSSQCQASICILIYKWL